MGDFPPDLPDLLRLACKQGKLRLNVWFGAREATGRGYQANLANAGQGWTVDYDRDALVAIEKVLRVRFGAQLERERVRPPVDHRQLDIEDAIAADIEGLIG